MSKTINDEDFQKRAKEVIGSFAELGPESDFVPKAGSGSDGLETFEEWYSRVFGGPVELETLCTV